MCKAYLIETTKENIHEFGMCGYKNLKNEGYRKKVEWTKKFFDYGMKYKILYSEKDVAVGGIEYIDGENAFRPVDAGGYLFIHCLYIMKKDYKGKGYGEMMLQDCIDDAKKQNKHGVAVITRKGTWMAKRDLFIKHGFEVIDSAKPDFELLAYKFNPSAPAPSFRANAMAKKVNKGKGLQIYYSEQCPYTDKAINEIPQAAQEFGINAELINLDTPEKAQKSPCAFGTFYITFNGKVIAENPISQTRFKNILSKIVK